MSFNFSSRKELMEEKKKKVQIPHQFYLIREKAVLCIHTELFLRSCPQTPQDKFFRLVVRNMVALIRHKVFFYI